MNSEAKFLTLEEASKWISSLLNRKITKSNLSYLINYGKIAKYTKGKNILVDKEELQQYYENSILKQKEKIREKLEDGIDWNLSFDSIPEKERTKHVHRLHPYKGKFIPQLVEYFLDKYFKSGDIILDPFSGSGTTLIQANEMNIHSVGIDISLFNTMITEVKFANINLSELTLYINIIFKELSILEKENKIISFDNALKQELKKFNQINFPSPEFKQKWRLNQIEKEYINNKVNEFLQIYENLRNKYKINIFFDKNNSFLEKWYIPDIINEAQFILEFINNIEDEQIKKTLIIILSRSIHSARATTHMDLDRLKNPQYYPYYCYKHFKICKPIFSLFPIFKQYAFDTLKRLLDYQKLKTNAYQIVLTGDSKNINIFEEVQIKNKEFYEILKKKKITGIFTSPPYLGQINYHEEHAYAYELFGIERKDEFEIGAPSKEGNQKDKYIKEISAVLKNSLQYMNGNPLIIIVANDKYNLYPKIAEDSQLQIINKINRPVLNRTARDNNIYSESIFIMKKK